MDCLYVESNFILELAFLQKEHEACERIMQAAEQATITLVVPAYCLAEVFETIRSRRSQRTISQEVIQREILQHQREAGAAAADMEMLSRLLRELMLARTETQTKRLFATTERIAQATQVLALTPTILAAAQRVQYQFALSPQDALVYASIQEDLVKAPATRNKLFLSRNEADFKKPGLLAELRHYNCDYLSSFGAAAGRLRL